MFQGGSMIFTVLAFIVIGAIIYYFPQVDRKEWYLRIALSMQLGGAVGNLVDRLTQDGRVTDFISVGNFPVFNIADASISVGTVVLLLGVYLQERAQQRAKRNTGDSGQASEATIE
jgi:signal peptidase II